MRYIIIMILTYLAYKFLKGLFIPTATHRSQASGEPERKASGEDLVEDPYCHTYIPLSNSIRTTMQGKTVYFCSKKCLEEFKEIQESKI